MGPEPRSPALLASWDPAGAQHLVLLAVLLLLPRILQRFRVPTGITAFGIGVAAGLGLGFGRDGADPVVQAVSVLGISSLFLTAGLEVDLDEMRGQARVLVQHLAVRAALLAVGTGAFVQGWGLDVRAAAVASLAVLTPSAGFILESLSSLGLYRDERAWVRSKVIAAELLALGVLVFVSQDDVADAGIAGGVIAALVLLLPVVLRWFASWVLPYAPRSEFTFVVLLAVLCAVLTRALGVYYLVGAFVVGLTARRFRERVPALSSDSLLHAVEAFTTLAVPFYFFHAGTKVADGDLSLASVLGGLAFLGVFGALRVGSAALHDVVGRSESWPSALRKAVPMLPTLVFTIVCVGILRERFDVPQQLLGALVVYAVLTTLMPTVFFPRIPQPDPGALVPEFATDDARKPPPAEGAAPK